MEINVTDNVNDEPVIVDQIWKTPDQSMESLSIIHHAEDVRILPAAMDSKVSECEIKKIPVKLEQDTNIILHQTATILPGRIDCSRSQDRDAAIRTLPGKLILPENNMYSENNKRPPLTPVNTPLPEDFIANENKTYFDIKYSPEKVENTTKENQIDVKNRKVGKLDLNFWQKQVEDNKKFVGSDKLTKKETHLETQKILPGTMVFEKPLIEAPKMLPTKIVTRPESRDEIPTLPTGKIYRPRDVSPSEPLRPELVTNDRKLQVPEILPETPLTKSVKKDFETQRSHIDVPVIYPGKIEFTPKVHTIETPIILPEIINFKVDDNSTNNAKTVPEQNDISKEHTHNVSHQILPGKIDFNINDQLNQNKIDVEKVDITVDDNKFETAKILPGRIDFKHNENKIEFARPLPSRINLNPYENIYKSKHLNDNISKDAISVSDGFSNKIKDDFEADDLDVEAPSDPELVDSEPEIKETREPIMNKLKNKIFFIANKMKNKDKPADPLPTPTDTIENEPNTDITKVENNDSDMGSLDYITCEYKDSGAKSDVEFDKTDNQTREDIKRTKSLAELDLGDVVKGKVQRMVYKIKSVDLEKAETPRARKISVKEMPRKSSVLEKIALFEVSMHFYIQV